MLPVRTNVYLWLFNLASSLAPAPLCRFAWRRRLEPGTSAGAGCTNCDASAVPEDCLTLLLVSVGNQRCSLGIVTKQRDGSLMFLGSICGRCNKCRFPEAPSPVVPPPSRPLRRVPGAFLPVAERLGRKADHIPHLVPLLMCGAVTSLPRMPSWRQQGQLCGLPCLSLSSFVTLENSVLTCVIQVRGSAFVGGDRICNLLYKMY